MTTPELSVQLLERAEGESLFAWADVLRDLRPALQEVGRVFHEDAAENISARRDPWGRAWAPPSSMTIEVARKRGKTAGGTTQASSIKVTVQGVNTVKVAVRSKSARTFHFGQTSMRVFGRSTSKAAPPRALLPIRDGRVDAPEELIAKVKSALLAKLKEQMRQRSAPR